MNHMTTHNPAPTGVTLPDGALVLIPDQLAVFGDGDPARGRRFVRRMLGAMKEPVVYNGPTERPMSVIAAGPDDEQAAFDLLMMDLHEYADRIALIDADRVRAHVEAGTKRRGAVCGIVKSADGVVAGVTLLVPMQWWWSQEWFLHEVVTYVHPDHRKSNHVDELLAFQKWVADTWTKQFGYRVYLQTGILSARRVWEKIALYRRKFWQAGIVCIYPRPSVGGDP